MAHILIIDEQADIRDVLERMLRRAGYTVNSATFATMHYPYSWATPPNLVLVDLSHKHNAMPQAVTALRARLPNTATPTIVMSTYSIVDPRLILIEGYVDVIIKPFMSRSLLDSVKRALK